MKNTKIDFADSMLVTYIKGEIEKGKNNTEIYESYEDCVKKFNLNIKQASFERRIRVIRQKLGGPRDLNLPKNKDLGFSLEVEENTKSGTKHVCSRSSELKTIEDLIAYSKQDMDIWDLDKSKVGTYGSENNENYMVQAWFKKKSIQELSFVEQKKAIKEFFEETKPKVMYEKDFSFPMVVEDGHLLEINIADLHLGRISYEYDMEIGIKRFQESIMVLAERSSHLKISEVNLVLSGDTLNIDNTKSSTTGGTLQENAVPYKELYKRGLEMITMSIDFLISSYPFKKVNVFVVQGNHDNVGAYTLGLALENRFYTNERVDVVTKDFPRLYAEWGKTLLCYTHGQGVKKGSLPLVVMKEARDQVSGKDFIEIHRSHLHAGKVTGYSIDTSMDNSTIIERVVPSLANDSIWEAEKGYLCIPESIGFVYCKNEGLINEIKYRPNMHEKRQEREAI